jgi:hypothetical protein
LNYALQDFPYFLGSKKVLRSQRTIHPRFGVSRCTPCGFYKGDLLLLYRERRTEVDKPACWLLVCSRGLDVDSTHERQIRQNAGRIHFEFLSKNARANVRQ